MPCCDRNRDRRSGQRKWTLRGNPGCGRRSGCSLRSTGSRCTSRWRDTGARRAGRGDEYLHGSLLCRREADPRSPCCAGTLAASGGNYRRRRCHALAGKGIWRLGTRGRKAKGRQLSGSDERRGKSNSGGLRWKELPMH